MFIQNKSECGQPLQAKKTHSKVRFLHVLFSNFPLGLNIYVINKLATRKEHRLNGIK